MQEEKKIDDTVRLLSKGGNILNLPTPALKEIYLFLQEITMERSADSI